MIHRVENEVAVLKRLAPVAVVTGSYPSIPVTCRMLKFRSSGSCSPLGSRISLSTVRA